MGTNIVLLDNWLIVFSACKSNILGSINGVLLGGIIEVYSNLLYIQSKRSRTINNTSVQFDFIYLFYTPFYNQDATEAAY